MARHTASRLESAYARGERTFCHWDLAGADLHGVDLSGADLRGARLCGADLRDAVLSAANLTAADLSEADLSGADLSDAQMGHVVLRRATFDDANLSGADLTAACLEAATLRRALLEDALLTRADLSRADLSRANLSRALLSGARARGTQLEGANLASADLTYVDLTNAALGHSVLLSANLKGAQLLGAQLEGADLRATTLADAPLEASAQTHTWLFQAGDAHPSRTQSLLPATGGSEARAHLPGSDERGLVHPVPGAEHTCALPMVAQWLQRAAARQAYRYMQGEAEPAHEVVALVRLHEYARTYLCRITRIPRSGDEQTILHQLLGELPEDLRLEAEPILMAAEQEAELAALEDLTVEEELRQVILADPPTVSEAPLPEDQDAAPRDGSPEALLGRLQQLRCRGDESWARLQGVLSCLENAYSLRAQIRAKLSKPVL